MAFEIVGEILKLTVLAGVTLAGILVILIWKKNLTRKVTFLRFFVQIMAVVAIFYLFTVVSWLVAFLVVLLLMTFITGRFFCGWICPFGLYMDVVTEIRKVTKARYRNLSERLNRSLHKLRYVILVVFLVLPFVLYSIPSWQYTLILFLSGPFKPITVLLGPLEPLIIPWKGILEFLGLNISYPYVSDITFYFNGDFIWIYVFAFVGLTVLGSFFVRRFWCRFCPTGSSLAIVNRFRGLKWVPILHIDKDEEKCTKCGICKRICPLQVTEVYEQKGGKITTSMCMLCLRCVEMCPYEDCLKVKMDGKTVFRARNWLEPSKTE